MSILQSRTFNAWLTSHSHPDSQRQRYRWHIDYTLK